MSTPGAGLGPGSTDQVPHVPFFDQGTLVYNDPPQIYGRTILPGNYPQCIICGNTVYCGGVQCPNATVLPLAPDQVPMVQETFQSVQVPNYQQGQLSTDPQPGPGYRVVSLITQVA